MLLQLIADVRKGSIPVIAAAVKERLLFTPAILESRPSAFGHQPPVGLARIAAAPDATSDVEKRSLVRQPTHDGFQAIADICPLLQHTQVKWTLAQKSIQDLAPTSEQNANLSELVSALRGFTPPKKVTKNGYDAAISLHWDSFEVAAYPDRFETYQFYSDETVIHNWPHAPGAPIPAEMIEETAKATR